MSDMDNDEPLEDKLQGTLAQAAQALKAPPPTALPRDFAARVVRQAGTRADSPLVEPDNGLGDWLAGWLPARLAGWFRLRTQTVRPAWQWAWVAALCAVTAVLSIHWSGDDAEVVMVRFSVVAPLASSVSVAGDFNGWTPGRIRLQDLQGDGRWQAVVPMEPGVYQYMFVVDGERWIADPQAAEALDDGFGRQNSLMRIVADDFL